MLYIIQSTLVPYNSWTNCNGSSPSSVCICCAASHVHWSTLQIRTRYTTTSPACPCWWQPNTEQQHYSHQVSKTAKTQSQFLQEICHKLHTAKDSVVSKLLLRNNNHFTAIIQVNPCYSTFAPVPPVYNGCLAWYNVVLTPQIRSSVKYSQLRQSANICDARNQPTRTLYMYTKSQWQEINIYPKWLYCTLEWYVELTIRHTTPDIRCTQLYSLTMTTEATFSQLPTTYCFHCQPCSCNMLRL